MASIEFRNVTKTYSRLGRQVLFRSFLKHQMATMLAHERLKAIDNLSFHVADGESLAIVGHNGAGKSTILNLIAALTYPDAGAVEVNGSVAPLLELAAGFHPDLTGAENLVVNAALLGLSRKQVRESYDQIVDFSELREFLHQPLRTYSSGMIMRLAFSVAISVNPDILLVDEVLAVGDANFQRKCSERIRSLKRAGTLFLCVSHSPAMLRELCSRALWIEHGTLRMSGSLDEVLEAYERGQVSTQTEQPRPALQPHRRS
jgi:ABC-type polysaccharide/polyol phosphate transport system ATPase subunit